MRMSLPVLVLFLVTGCQELRLPLSMDFQSIARGEAGLPNLYFYIIKFHNSKFQGDPFLRILRTSIEQRLKPAPQQSEAAIESWTVESTSHKLYRYSVLISVTREARFETVLTYEVILVNDPI